jgi:hypothetical protein
VRQRAPSRLLQGLAASAILGQAGIANAASRVALRSHDCSPELSAELERLISVELTGAELDGASNLSLGIDCRRNSTRIVVFEGALPRAERSIASSAIEEPARARVLAIAAAELLRASVQRFLAVSHAQPAPSEPVRRAQRSLAIAAGATLQSFVTGAGPFLGGALLSRVQMSGPWQLEASAALSSASERLSRGRAELLLGSAFLGPALQVRKRGPESSAFLGVRIGWLRARGEADVSELTMSRTITLPWAALAGGADLRVWSAVPGVGVRIEGGYTLVNAFGRVDDARELELKSAFVTLAAFFAFGV